MRTEKGWILLLGGLEGLAAIESANLDDYPSLAGGGDLDGDGFDDVVVVDSQERILLLRGGLDGFSIPLVAKSRAGREQLGSLIVKMLARCRCARRNGPPRRGRARVRG